MFIEASRLISIMNARFQKYETPYLPAVTVRMERKKNAVTGSTNVMEYYFRTIK
jgi:hypothetical protein